MPKLKVSFVRILKYCYLIGHIQILIKFYTQSQKKSWHFFIIDHEEKGAFLLNKRHKCNDLICILMQYNVWNCCSIFSSLPTKENIKVLGILLNISVHIVQSKKSKTTLNCTYTTSGSAMFGSGNICSLCVI